MGNDLKKAGVKPGGDLNMDLVNKLWAKNDPKNTGHLDKKSALKFLEAFCDATKTAYTTEHAESLLEFCGGGPKGAHGLDKATFAFVLSKEAQIAKMRVSPSVAMLTQSKQAEQITKQSLNTAVAPYLGSIKQAANQAMDAAGMLEKAGTEWAAAGNADAAARCSALAALMREETTRINAAMIEIQTKGKELAKANSVLSVEDQAKTVAAVSVVPEAVTPKATEDEALSVPADEEKKEDEKPAPAAEEKKEDEKPAAAAEEKKEPAAAAEENKEAEKPSSPREDVAPHAAGVPKADADKQAALAAAAAAAVKK